MENVSRQRCCAPLRSGGLNVVDFRAKCAALRLSNFSSLRDNFGSQKWHFLARYSLGNCLQKLDMRFSFISNLIPVSSEPSRFIGLVFLFFSRFMTNIVHYPMIFHAGIFIYFWLFFLATRLSPLVFWGPLLVALSTGGLRCGVNLV